MVEHEKGRQTPLDIAKQTLSPILRKYVQQEPGWETSRVEARFFYCKRYSTGKAGVVAMWGVLAGDGLCGHYASNEVELRARKSGEVEIFIFPAGREQSLNQLANVPLVNIFTEGGTEQLEQYVAEAFKLKLPYWDSNGSTFKLARDVSKFKKQFSL